MVRLYRSDSLASLQGTVGEQLERKEAFVEELRSMPVAINTGK